MAAWWPFAAWVLIVSGVLQLTVYLRAPQTGMAVYEFSNQWMIHAAYLLASLLFGFVQLYMAAGFFVGKRNLERVPLLYLVAVAWGILNLILAYVFYAKSSSFVENFFSVISCAALLLPVQAFCRG